MVSPSDSPIDPALRSRRESALGHLQPFALDVCQSWHEASEEASVPLHDRALDELRTLQAQDRVMLLNAPRAGHGKTHLLGRVAHKLSGEAIVAGLPWQSRDDVSWTGCGHGVLQDLASGTVQPNALQRACAGVLATLLRRLIQTGRIPSTDPVQALRVLSQDPMDLFNDRGNAKVIGEWFRKHFDQLRKPLADISSLDGPDLVEDWLTGFFEYVNQPTPAVFALLEARIDAGGAQAARFIRLLTAWRPIVLVADHMDGLYRDPQAGVAVARMTLALTSLPGVHVVLSVNQDLWETTFGRQLPSALEDRLSSNSVTLRGLTAVDAAALISLRLREAGVESEDEAAFLRFVDMDRFFMGRPVGSVSARGLLRHLAQMWRHWLKNDGEASQASTGSGSGLGPAAAPALVSDERPGLAAESFLMEPEPRESEAENLQKLADNLRDDEGGTVVNLSSPDPAPVQAPPFVGAAPLVVVSGGPLGAIASPPPLRSVPPPPSVSGPVPVAQPALAPAPTPPVVFFDKPALSILPPADPAMSTPSPAARQAGLTEVPPTTFHKLRQMLAKLKVATDSVPLSEAALSSQQAAGTHSNGTSAASLQARYERLRHEIAGTSRPTFVETAVVNDLVRLAGKRFPVVNYDEVELPGLLGRSLPRWTLSGMELVFGLEDFSETRYWKTVSSYMVGRMAEIQASAVQGGTVTPHVKLVVFKGDHEAAGLVALLRDETIPPPLRSIVDAVHLDPRSLASLYAMHQIIRETETGAIQADTNAVLSTLANELDFFWKRVTRPKV